MIRTWSHLGHWNGKIRTGSELDPTRTDTRHRLIEAFSRLVVRFLSDDEVFQVLGTDGVWHSCIIRQYNSNKDIYA